MVEQVPLPGEPRPAQLALEGRYTLRELRGQVLHEVSAVVLLELALGGEGLVADLAHLVVTLVAGAVCVYCLQTRHLTNNTKMR